MRRYYPGWTINKRWSSSNVKMLSVRVIRRILTNDYVAMRWLAHLAKVMWQASDAIVYMYDVTTHQAKKLVQTTRRKETKKPSRRQVGEYPKDEGGLWRGKRERTEHRGKPAGIEDKELSKGGMNSQT